MPTRAGERLRGYERRERWPAKARNERGAVWARSRPPSESTLELERRRRGARRSHMASSARRPPRDPARRTSCRRRYTVRACWKKFTATWCIPRW